MIEKLECTCIEAYKTRKMRDPNCCACSCDHNNLVEELAKANERAKELESHLVEVKNGATGQATCSKYCEARAVGIEMRNLKSQLETAEQRCAELDEIADTAFKYNHSSAQFVRAWRKLQELRKEQE